MNDETFEVLVEGVLRIELLEDARLTHEALVEHLATLGAGDGVAGEVERCRGVLQQAARQGWNAPRMDKELKQGEFSAGQAAAFVSVWRRQEDKVREVLTSKSFWGNKLQNLSWRVDVAARSRAAEDLNEPCAVVEMAIGRRQGADAGAPDAPQVVRFEMDRAAIANLHSECQRLQKLVRN
mmetsp:Transcript_49388/g.112521  ORF Transcript_49388/g.112521 Transcript_49388/m.112521 type:complete len:181 (-) Transcript_49388:228-770(-)|eukprot:CAMPEP_0180235408 /NCGR_PEP_ID=MMETSP0987-20121128/29197_1 /TAXON_ID=697907 /ORGANISM="non described non described, Strain CCMP2293" /LENGTH=180 /DNA_ID=CAMNT_0022201499 /DNA_START=56 /DNA_END=598 /DNA_ORIENTATION=+